MDIRASFTDNECLGSGRVDRIEISAENETDQIFMACLYRALTKGGRYAIRIPPGAVGIARVDAAGIQFNEERQPGK